MNQPTDKDCVLLRMAAEGLAPAVDGCAAALAGPALAVGGTAVVSVAEKAINLFGGRIVERWRDWLREQPETERLAALEELAGLMPQQAREQAEAALRELTPNADPSDRSLALEYLAAIPRTVERALVRDHGKVSVSIVVNLEEPQALLLLLPTDIPPYQVPGPLPGTPYRLEQLLGSGGFGAVYRASAATLQHLPLAIKFCLDRSLASALRLERDNLERLMKAGGEGWARRIVRLYGYDLDYRTPYLVYEYVPGGDLQFHLTRLKLRAGRALNPGEANAIVMQIAEALAFAHSHGLVHRDLKPANILVDDGQLKLADFGLGGVMAARAQVSRIGATTVSLLTAAEQASLFRGAGTPLYMSPEQRRGANPDPRHDLYSLGVIWYQLLVNDTSRELHAGWAKELAVRFKVSREQINLIEACVGWFEERPKDGAALLAQMRDDPMTVLPATQRPLLQPTLPAERAGPNALTERVPLPDQQGEMRRSLFVAGLRRLSRAQRLAANRERLWLFPMLLIAMIAGWFPGHLTGELIYSAIHPSEGFLNIGRGHFVEPSAIILAIFVGLIAGALLFAGQIWIWQHRRRDAAEEATRIARGLSDEHADALAAWGGPNLLDSPESVETLIRHVEMSPTLMPAGDVRRKRFDHSLHASLLEGMSRVVRLVDQIGSPPWFRAIVFATPLAWLLGHLFGESVYTCVYPDYGYFNTFRRVPFNVWVVLAGIAMGIVLFVVMIAVQYVAWRWHVGRLNALADRFEEQLRRLFPEYGSAGGTTGLRDAEAVTLVARRAASHDTLTQPPTSELRSKLLAELRQLLEFHERR
jgi:serine/threonine protein kinase